MLARGGKEIMWSREIWEKVWESVALFLPTLLSGLLVLAAFWLLAIGVRRLVGRLMRFRRFDAGLAVFLSGLAHTCVLLFGLVTALGTMGVNVTALVTGLGLGGFALSFAFKDIISNALAGILVLIYKPFRLGDRIAVLAFEGNVTEINLRYTVLDADGKKVLIPNSALFTNPVTVLKRDSDGPGAAPAQHAHVDRPGAEVVVGAQQTELAGPPSTENGAGV